MLHVQRTESSQGREFVGRGKRCLGTKKRTDRANRSARSEGMEEGTFDAGVATKVTLDQ